MIKFIFPVLILLCNNAYGQADNNSNKSISIDSLKKIKTLFINDPIYESGDTLYLFYDPLDSLQHLISSRVLEWKLRDVSLRGKPGTHWKEYERFARQFRLHELRDSLTLKDLEGIVLTSRQEFGDFYQRTYERSKGMEIRDGKIKEMSFYFWNLGNHFSWIYVFVVQHDGWITEYYTSLRSFIEVIL